MDINNVTLLRSCSTCPDPDIVTFLIVDPLSLPTVVFCCIMLGVTFILGTLGSILVVACYARNKTLWTSTNAIIVNISVSDLFMLSIGVPLAIVVLVYNLFGMTPGMFACRVQTFGSSLSNIVTLLTLDAVTLNRYFAVVHPFAG
jgi:hypothetical protein